MPLLGSLAAGSVKGFGAQANLGYFFGQSLRFRSSATAYLERTPTSAGNQKTFTLSFWVKRGLVSTSGNFQRLFYAGITSDYFSLLFDGSGSGAENNMSLYVQTSSAQAAYCLTNAKFRDPSAWYHVVWAIDTTQATASNRIKCYINGVQQTFSTATYPTQNADIHYNDTVAHSISQNLSGYGFDGYLTEIHSIDGQALTPSDFGKTDPSTGSWIPKKYAGTYGTNGFKLDFKEPNPNSVYYSFDVDGTGDYISAPAAQYANYINGSGDFTIEWWVNYDALPSDGAWYSQDSGSAVVSPFNLFQQTNSWRLYATTADAAWNVYSNTLLATTSLTTGRWYHIACVRYNGTLTLYVDGTAVGNDGGTISTSSLWEDTSHNLSLFNDWQSAGGGGGINGRISNYRIVKGTAVYTGNFTRPTELLEDITNTTLLMARSTSIEDSSGNITISGNGNLAVNNQVPPLANGPGKDVSGNDNHWGLKDIVFGSENSAATTYDLMNDVPTLTSPDKSNFCTLNSAAPSYRASGTSTISNANLTSTDNASGYGLASVGTVLMTSGKWYWEVDATSIGGSYGYIGIAKADTLSLGSSNIEGYIYSNLGYKASGAAAFAGIPSTAYGASWTTGDVIGVALDMDAGTLVFYKNGVSQGTAYTGITGEYVSGLGDGQTATAYTFNINFGQRPFAYTPPTGYKKLNTYNL